MSRIRKSRILEGAQPVSEYESAAREGMDNIADAVRTLAGVMASVAASQNTHNPGDHMAMVIYADAQERFGDVHKKMDAKTQKQLESWLDGLCKAKR